jgi:hypothetical protein
MKTLSILALVTLVTAACVAQNAAPRERILPNDSWRFTNSKSKASDLLSYLLHHQLSIRCFGSL